MARAVQEMMWPFEARPQKDPFESLPSKRLQYFLNRTKKGRNVAAPPRPIHVLAAPYSTSRLLR